MGRSHVCVLLWLLSSPVHAWSAGGALEGRPALASAAKHCDMTAAPLQECHPRGPRRAPTTPPRRGQPPVGSVPRKAESPFRRAIGWQSRRLWERGQDVSTRRSISSLPQVPLFRALPPVRRGTGTREPFAPGCCL